MDSDNSLKQLHTMNNSINILSLLALIAIISCNKMSNDDINIFRISGDIESVTFIRYEDKGEVIVSVPINDSNLNANIINLINNAKFIKLNSLNYNEIRGSELNSLVFVWRNGSTPRVIQIGRNGFAVDGAGHSYATKNSDDIAYKIYDMLIQNGLISSMRHLDPFAN